jgi:hypothetical protein
MMLRICGVEEQQPAWKQLRCWCGGLFCGPGGQKRSQEFRRDYRGATTITSLGEAIVVVAQLDLFDGDAKGAKWLERIRGSRRG